MRRNIAAQVALHHRRRIAEPIQTEGKDKTMADTPAAGAPKKHKTPATKTSAAKKTKAAKKPTNMAAPPPVTVGR